MTEPGATVRLFMTGEHDCPYLPDRQARNIVVDPGNLNPGVYCELLKLGFRRSGEHVYRPHCSGCSACRSLRVPVEQFAAGRSMRRNLKANQDLRLNIVEAQFKQEYFDLYSAYLSARHSGGGMDESTPEDFEKFLLNGWCDTAFFEARRGNTLIGVGVVDLMSDCLSAVYTFFDPDHPNRGLGTWAVLQQIQMARDSQRKWLYLGYWLSGCQKMAYKSRFQPSEVYVNGEWTNMNDASDPFVDKP